MSMRMNMERRMAHIKVGIERVPRDTMGNLFTAKDGQWTFFFENGVECIKLTRMASRLQKIINLSYFGFFGELRFCPIREPCFCVYVSCLLFRRRFRGNWCSSWVTQSIAGKNQAVRNGFGNIALGKD